jgi:HPt (histidine-containing phosphotransfer) domain-containing protein
MQKITYSKEYMYNLYNGSENDIHFVLTEFSKEVAPLKEALVNGYNHSDPQGLIEVLHKNYAGFAYAGFPQISNQIKILVEDCKKIKRVTEIYIDFNKLLIAIDQCNEICAKQLKYFESQQNYV